MSTCCYEISSVPDKPFDRGLFLEVMGRESFAIAYDMSRRMSFLVFDPLSDSRTRVISSVIAGLDFRKGELDESSLGFHIMSAYRGLESFPQAFLSDIFDAGLGGILYMIFVPQTEKEISPAREYMERKLSGISVASGYSVSDSGSGKRTSRSIQHQSFERSDESSMLREMLETLNRSVTANGLAYKIAFATTTPELKEYLLSKMVLLDSHAFNGSADELIAHIEETRCMPFGSDFAKRLVNFYGSVETSYTIATSYASSLGDVPLGNFLKDSVHETSNMIMVNRTALNLGFIISGLPGSGKTREAMSILDSAMRVGSTRVIVISPTDEWDSFALSHRMYLIKLCEDSIPINFFRCPRGTDRQRFYESLAMILASASAAGPYRNPMEKCMLNAFRRVYKETDTPDPVAVYSEIEESIARMHGKRTNVGIKYTKHGENIKSSMENLVAVLQMPEYSERRGVCIEELLEGGMVFDISGAGVETKTHFYALILNQIYSVASSLDSNGDDDLRIVICLEEAQMMLREQRSPVVEDMRNRIQDFRKKGVGLMLLAHNITDIDVGIRRLCQMKIYLKQASDVAEAAAGDLVFAHAEQEDISSKLKHLDSRVGALSYVSKEGNEKRAHDSVFIKTKEYMNLPVSEYQNPVLAYAKKRRLAASKRIVSTIVVRASDDVLGLRIMYLGEEIGQYVFGEGPKVVSGELIESRSYSVELLGPRDRVLRRLEVVATPEIGIDAAVK